MDIPIPTKVYVEVIQIQGFLVGRVQLSVGGTGGFGRRHEPWHMPTATSAILACNLVASLNPQPYICLVLAWPLEASDEIFLKLVLFSPIRGKKCAKKGATALPSMRHPKLLAATLTLLWDVSGWRGFLGWF